MMNTIKKILLLIGCVLFVSCGNFSTSDNEEIPEGKGKLCISTDLKDNRSVLPEAINANTFGFSWELEGTCGSKTFSKDWSDSSEKSNSAYQLMTSDTEIYIDVGTWNFTLTVYNDSSQKVLSAVASATIKAGETTPISFVMQEASDSDVAGSIDFTLKIPGGFEGEYVASLYELNKTDATDTKDGQIESNITSIIYSNDNISAGYYILQIDLRQNTGDATASYYQTINTYTCLVRVAPGLCSKGEYTLNSLAKLYTITYECNQGNFGNETITTSYNEYTTFTLPTPTLSGHTFAGWYTDETYDTPASDGGTYKISSDTTVYAKWIKNVEGITYANNTLYISSYEGLCVFRNIVNGTLESDITIPANADHSGENVSYLKANSVTNCNVVLESDITIDEDWIPIGVYKSSSLQVPYVGEFNGNNKTIKFGDSVKVNSQAAGLFGAISTGCNIYNLIIDGNIQYSSTSTAYAGGIVGYATGGSIQNCVNKAKIQGTWAGGIAGKAQSTSFNGCVNFGEINGTNYSAGIVGSAASDTSINLCINVGKLTSDTTACGISGDVPSDIIVQNCINLGALLASSSIYGISSVDSTSQGNIISCNISAGKFEGTVQYNCYAVSSSASNTNYYDSSICTDDNFCTDSAVGKVTSEFSNWSPDNGIFWSADEGRYPLPNLSNNIPTDIWNAICEAAKISVSDPVGGGGSITYGGTDSTGVPIFYVYSAEGLATFRNIVNGTLLDDTLTSYTISADSSVPGIADYSITTSDAFTNISGVLQADIDLSGIEWIPIGTEDFPFKGSFDGQNKTISNLTISNATTENQGLFGVFDCSLSDEKMCLSNICVTGSITTSSPYAGGLVGQATNIVFQNCENSIKINSSSETVGGLVGKADTCDFIGCTNYADIISTSSSSYNLCVGGIAGLITDVTAEYCYNAGNISANMSVGGIFGFEQNSSISYPPIEYCVNTGVITGSSYYGGIVGYASKALSLGYCANYGEITYSGNDDNPENGFILGGCSSSSSNTTLATEILSVGKSSSNGTAPTNPTYYAVSKNASVTYSYYDSDKLTDIQWLSSNGGGDSLSTSELINGTTLDNFYYGDWNYENGRYPIPDLEGEISSDAWNLLVNTVSTL